MPRYDLYCPTCDRTEEVQRGMNDPNPACGTCGAAREQLPPTGTGFALKGGGWAKDNYSKGRR